VAARNAKNAGRRFAAWRRSRERRFSPASFFFGLESGYWLRVQMAYDLREALHPIGPKNKASVQPLKAA
jgi:hypothetical protein